MLHILLAVYIIAFSLAVVVIILSFLGYARTGRAIFAHSALLFCAVLLLLLRESFNTYEKITPELVFGGTLPLIEASLTFLGRVLLAFVGCLVACEIVTLRIAPWRHALHAFLAAAAAAAGVIGEIRAGALFAGLDEIVLACVQVYAIVVVLVHFREIVSPAMKTAVQVMLLLAALMLVGTAAQMIAEAERPSATLLSDFPIAQVVFYFAAVAVFLFFSLRYVFQLQQFSSFEVPEDIAQKYSISPREKEIIAMIVQGYPNRAIGEKLFISSTTVKNHVYHIYQKTGVANKVQLINLMNSPK